MDFGKAFTYMFQDPNWLGKLGIGTLLMLVGIVPRRCLSASCR